MPDEASLFQTSGLTWADRAALNGLEAVLAPGGDWRLNTFLHGVHSYAARTALKHFRPGDSIIDFGCGIGRFSKFFASRQYRVLATDITFEMIARAKVECQGKPVEFRLTNGIDIPVASGSIGGIWCCGVLRYSLFVTNPAYDAIAREMLRVLRPGGYVVNCEMYVDAEPDVFNEGFEAAGFETRGTQVLHRYGSRLERLTLHRFFPGMCVTVLGRISASWYAQIHNARCNVPGLRDYLFVWQKPVNPPKQAQA